MKFNKVQTDSLTRTKFVNLSNKLNGVINEKVRLWL
jgi:hypothetical protein